MALITLNQLKSHLGILLSEVKYDTKLTLFLEAASAWIETFCNRRFESATYTELLHGNRSNMINPLQWPITDVDELRISDDRAWSDASTLVDAANYGTDSEQISVILYSGYFSYGFNNVRLVYTAGYATIPADLQLAALWAAEWYYLHNTRGDQGRGSVGKQGESVSILTDIPPMIKSILQLYRRIELPNSGLSVNNV